MPGQNINGALGFLLSKGTQALHKQLNRNFNSNNFDITHEQWAMLVFLYHCEGKSHHEIAENTFRDKVSVTKIIDNLEKRELVYRTPDEKDKRVKRIFMTESGRELIPELREIAHETLKEGFSGIKKSDIESFKKVLSEVVKNFTGEDLLAYIKLNEGKWK